MNQLQMFHENIRLLIGILACLGIGGFLAVVLYVALRVAASEAHRRKSLQQYDRQRRDAAGRPLPPSGLGICDVCGQAPPKVHYLPDGSRRCPSCLNS